MKTKRPRTPNRGAADTRRAILVEIEDRMDKVHTNDEWNLLNNLGMWIRKMATRASKRPGGLGRKAKRA